MYSNVVQGFIFENRGYKDLERKQNASSSGFEASSRLLSCYQMLQGF